MDVAADVVFANRHLAAVDTSSGAKQSAWRPLLDARSNAGIEPIQFALAGMNIHINYDLPQAVVATCVELGTEPAAHHADYQRVDALLDAAEQSVRQSFEPTDVRQADQHVARDPHPRMTGPFERGVTGDDDGSTAPLPCTA